MNEIEAKKKTIEKMNESWFFEKINNIDKHLARLTKKKRKRVQTNKIRGDKGEVTTDATEIRRSWETSVSKCMPMKWATWKKWTNS